MAQWGGGLVTMTVHERDDGAVVRLGGRLDRRSAADVRAAVGDLLLEAGRPVLLDLEETVIGDSTALGLLVELRRRAQRHGTEVRVVAADDRTVRLLLRARLGALLAAPLRSPRAAERAALDDPALAGTA
ncbi:STAS domain-containing protein [Phycicoccus duodecadis]|uniref:Anti-anti-sigma factor n=1 Tax=Phycicoccus duodecadis TaxID=173053 RepID=A0A2N3YGQ1_9MICO|nr:STAS domain-containing protein [Phycicoccus duodecadis]PKW26032.1 anti-anti-sigma factor [Phycicoccus duodecadis]